MQRHNEVGDTIYDLAAMSYHLHLAAMVWGQTTKEPAVIRKANENSSGTLLRADIRERGAWQTQATPLFDIHVIDTDAKFLC